MLLAPELTLCRDQGWGSGVTEVPGEPAPPAEAVFTGLPNLHALMSPQAPQHRSLPRPGRICPWFQTPGAMLVQR